MVCLLFIAAGFSSVFGQSSWTWRNLTPGQLFNGLVYADGRHVAVGSGGRVSTSFDGIEWETKSSITRNTLSGIAYGEGLYVAVGDGGTILTSEDAQTWGQQNAGVSNALNAVVFAQGLFVVVGGDTDGDGIILTSPDGRTWTQRDPRVFSQLLKVAYGNGRYVATGVGGQIRYSYDGIHWNPGASVGIGYPGIVHGAGRFVVAGWGYVYASTDLMSWQKSSIPDFIDVSSLSFGNGVFVAIGTLGLYRSSDGFSWAKVSFPSVMTRDPAFVAFGNGTFLATWLDGSSGAISLLTSSDGLAWTSRSAGTPVDLYNVTFRNGQFVSEGASNTVLRSPDGVLWSSERNQKLVKVSDWAFGNGVYVASGDGMSNGIRVSVDGENWTQKHPFGISVVFAEGRFLASASVGGCYSSVDGESWSPVGGWGPSGDRKLLYMEERYVGINGTSISSSEDGVRWTPRYWQSPSSEQDRFFDAAVGNGTVVAVGHRSDKPVIMTSSDGITWTNYSPEVGGGLSAIAYGGGYFVAVGGSGTVVSSPDGIQWTLQNTGAGYPSSEGGDFTDVTFAEGRFVIVGNQGAVLTALPTGGGPPPALLGPVSGRAIVGQPFSLRLEVSGQPASFQTTDLPDGFTLNSSTGVIEGTAPAPGRYAWTLTATNDYGSTDSSFVLDVIAEPAWRSYNPAPLPGAIRGLAHNGQHFLAAGDTGSIHASVDGVVWNTYPTGHQAHLNAIASGVGRSVAVGDGGAIATSTDSIHWQPVLTPSSQNLSGAAYGNGVFVAVGGKGTILNSADGTNWSSTLAPTPNDFTAITFGEGLFVATTKIGTGDHVFTSPDGIAWTRRRGEGFDDPSSVTWGGDRFVIVRTDSSLDLSSNGEFWTRISSQGRLYFRFHSVFYAEGMFVAVGEEGEIGTSDNGNTWVERSSGVTATLRSVVFGNGRWLAASRDGVLVSSPDGINWTQISNSAGNTLRDMTQAKGAYVAVGDKGRILTSADGKRWTGQSFSANPLKAVAFGADRFVAAGGRWIVASWDGLNWSSEAVLPEASEVNDLTFANGVFLAVGDAGKIWTSPDGAVWTERTSGVGERLVSVAFNAGEFLAVGDKSTILASTDAANWTLRANPTSSELTGVVHGHAGYVATGQDGLILRSTDGVAWTPIQLPLRVALDKVAYGGGQYVVTGSETIFTSVDGVTWSAQASGTHHPLYGVFWDGSRFLAAGGGEMIMLSSDEFSKPAFTYGGALIARVGQEASFSPYSTNDPRTFSASGLPPGLSIDSETGRIFGRATSAGNYQVIVNASNGGESGTSRLQIKMLNWQPETSSAWVSLNSVCYGNGVFVAVGTQKSIHRSIDGHTWTRPAYGDNYRFMDVIHEGGKFITVATSGFVFSSADGVSWRQHNVRARQDLYAIARGNGVYVAVGDFGTIVTSPDGEVWTDRQAPAPENCKDVTFGGGRFVVSTFSGNFFVSSDGINWTSHFSGKQAAINSVTYFNGRFFAVRGSEVLTSLTGADWSIQSSLGYVLRRITNIGGGLATVGSATVEEQPQSMISASSDGVSWVSHEGGASMQLQDVAAGNGVMVAVGDGGTILSSSVPFITSGAAASLAIDAPSFSYQVVAAAGAASYTASGLPPGLSIDPATGLISGLPEKPGTYTVTVGATRGGIDATSIVTITVPSLYEWWKGQSFTAEQRLDPQIIGDTIDLDGDGIKNLMEFALGLDPWVPDREKLPVSEILSADGSEYLGIRVTRPRYTGEVPCRVETSDSPAFLQVTLVPETGTPSPSGESSETRTYRDTVPLGDNPRRFIRVKFSNLPE